MIENVFKIGLDEHCFRNEPILKKGQNRPKKLKIG